MSDRQDGTWAREDMDAPKPYDQYWNPNDPTMNYSNTAGSYPSTLSISDYATSSHPASGYSMTSYSTSSYSMPSYTTPSYSTSRYPMSSQAKETNHVPRSVEDYSYTSDSTATMSQYTTRHRGSFSSAASVTSNALTTTTAPTVDGDQPPRIYPYDLACEFEFNGCGIRFHAEDVDDWISHEISHFGAAGPPPKSLCIFCDDVQFDRTNWRQRMLHIRDHLVREATAAFQPSPRPDFLLIEYIREIGMVSQEDYDDANRFTEGPYSTMTQEQFDAAMRFREPPHPGGSYKLYPLGHQLQTKESMLKAQRESQVPIDLERERRQQERSKKSKAKDTKDHKKFQTFETMKNRRWLRGPSGQYDS